MSWDISASESIGVTSGAFSIGKRALLEWLNDFLEVDYKKVEQIHDGAAACQLMDACFPGAIKLSGVSFDVNQDYMKQKNYKILQQCFQKVGISKNVNAGKLMEGKYQDNLEFFQWLKAFTDKQYDYNQEYPAAKRRRELGVPCKTVGKARSGASKAGSMTKRGSSTRPPIRNPATRTASSRSTRSTSSKPVAKTNSRPGVGAARSSVAAASGIQRRSSAKSSNTLELERQIEDLTNQLQEVMDAYNELKSTGETLETERNFYYQKLLNIENLTMVANEEPDAATDRQTLDLIVEILHSDGNDLLDEGEFEQPLDEPELEGTEEIF